VKGPRKALPSYDVNQATGWFLLFVAPSVGGSYWRMFSPAFVVLGFGLAVSVAPLMTTEVMNAVDQNRAGISSRINNAVARVAGLLTIAVLGVVMVNAFSSHLNRSRRDLAVSPPEMQDLRSNEIRLAGLAVPVGMNWEMTAGIRISIGRAFAFAFRLEMVICAGLFIASASFAWRMIASPRLPETQSRFSEAQQKG
jgi:hypothetical protein